MRDLIAVVAGAIIGTGLRLAIDCALPHGDSSFPLSTLLVNVLGCFALGALVARLWPRATSWQRALLGTGLLGSFTTFSAFAVSLVTLAAATEWALAVATEWALAVAYLAATLVLGIAAAFSGLALGRRRRPLDSVLE